MKNRGKDIILRIIDIAKESNFDNKKSDEIISLIEPFIVNLPNRKDPDELDLKTIAKLEALLGKEIIYVPTKTQWRKLKLEYLKELSNI